MSVIDDLLNPEKSESEPRPTQSKIQIPKRPSAPAGKAAGYAVVEDLNPGGRELVTAFVANVLNPQTCSDQDREFAARALMNATGRKLAVGVDDIFKYTSSFMGISIPVLMLLKVMFPSRGNAYLNLTPSLVIGTSLVALGLTVYYRRQPDITIVIQCSLIGFMLSIGFVNWV